MEKEPILQKAVSGNRLSFEESREIFSMIMDGKLAEAEIAELLVALKLQEITADEIAGAAHAMNSRKVRLQHNISMVVDTCGTGGDGKSTVNVSTAVALVMASFGYAVAKHGNIAQSGKVGSADILRMLGVPTDLGPDEAKEYFEENRFVFLFAQKYHPAMKYAGKVRRELKIPTIFNFLGPLANPADPDFQVIGINRMALLPVIAGAARKLGRKHLILYSSSDGFDEVSSSAPTQCYEIDGENIKNYTITPEEYFTPFPMPVARDETEAKYLFMKAISGEDENLSNLLSLNSALALRGLGRAKDIREGIELTKHYLRAGAVMDKLLALRI